MRRLAFSPTRVLALLLLLVPAVVVLPAGCSGTTTPSGPCESGKLECDGTCVDTATNLRNCGGCGKECAAGEACQSGLCLSGCAATLINCNGACVDVRSDPVHCGGCFRPCFPPGSVCQEGSCTTSCFDKLTDCNGSCVDLKFNPAHCGDCWHVCAPAEACIDGACSATCLGAACGACDAPVLSSIVPQNLIGSTVSTSDRYTPLCGGGGRDQLFVFSAPAAGRYIFDTTGSDYNTVLAALSPDCTERACNDDANGTRQSRLELDLAAGEVVYLLIDGVGGSSGTFALNISRPPAPPMCIAADLGSAVPQSKTGSTTGQPDSVAAPCGDPGGPDVAFSFTAPSARQYTFDTVGSDFDTVLHVHSDCTTAAIGCNDDGPSTGTQSLLTLSLDAGQQVVIVVDGFGDASGSVVLNIN